MSKCKKRLMQTSADVLKHDEKLKSTAKTMSVANVSLSWRQTAATRSRREWSPRIRLLLAVSYVGELNVGFELVLQQTLCPSQRLRLALLQARFVQVDTVSRTNFFGTLLHPSLPSSHPAVRAEVSQWRRETHGSRNRTNVSFFLFRKLKKSVSCSK